MNIITFDWLVYPSFFYEREMKYYKRYWRKHNWSKDRIRKYKKYSDRFDVLYGIQIRNRSEGAKKRIKFQKEHSRNK